MGGIVFPRDPTHVVRVAVQAAVDAGVVRADVHAFNASAPGPLPLVFFIGGWAFFIEIRRIHAAAGHNSESGQIVLAGARFY